MVAVVDDSSPTDSAGRPEGGELDGRQLADRVSRATEGEPIRGMLGDAWAVNREKESPVSRCGFASAGIKLYKAACLMIKKQSKIYTLN